MSDTQEAETLVERLKSPVMLHSNPEQTNAERREAAARITALEKECADRNFWGDHLLGKFNKVVAERDQARARAEAAEAEAARLRQNADARTDVILENGKELKLLAARVARLTAERDAAFNAGKEAVINECNIIAAKAREYVQNFTGKDPDMYYRNWGREQCAVDIACFARALKRHLPSQPKDASGSAMIEAAKEE